jgi:hypothetical protein
MAKTPTQRGVTISCLKDDYGANHFEAALTRWVAQYQNPHFTTKRQVQDAASNIDIPFNKVSVFNRIKFVSRDPFDLNPFAETTVDSIHVEPPKLDKRGGLARLIVYKNILHLSARGNPKVEAFVPSWCCGWLCLGVSGFVEILGPLLARLGLFEDH